MATRGRRGDSDTVNFRGIKPGGGGRSAHLDPDGGPYFFRIKKGEKKQSESGKHPYIGWDLEVARGAAKGKKIRNHVTSLNPQALWNLRGMMEACGVNPGDRSMQVPVIIKRLTGKVFQAEVEDDEYEGKVKSVIAEYVVKVKDDDVDEDDDEEEEDEEDEEEDEKPARRSRTSSKRKPADDDEDEDDEDEEEDEDEEDEDEEEEEEPAPKRATSRASSKATASSRRSSKSSRSAKRSKADDDDDDEDLDDIDLDDL